MAVKLDALPTVPDRLESDQIPTLTGDEMVRDARRIIAAVCGPWGHSRTNTSDYERDALLQELAKWMLEHPDRLNDRESGYPLARHERQAVLRSVLKRDLLRDSRAHLDSLQDVAIKRDRPRTKRPDIAPESVQEQADRHRAWDRDRIPATHTSLDAITRRHRSPDTGEVLWDEVAGDMERERQAGEQLPAVALAEDSRELCELMADRIIDALHDQSIGVERTARDAILTRLLLATGERLTAIAPYLKVSVPTAKRRSQAGDALMRTIRAIGVDVVAIRRASVAVLLEQDRATDPTACEPRSVADVDAQQGWTLARRTVDGAIRQAKRPMPATPANRGSGRDVCAYLARMFRTVDVCERPAHTIKTTNARALESGRALAWMSPAHGPALPVWSDPAVSLTGSAQSTLRPGQAEQWPDDIVAGQSNYRHPRHPAIIRDALAIKHGERLTSWAGTEDSDTDSD